MSGRGDEIGDIGKEHRGVGGTGLIACEKTWNAICRSLWLWSGFIRSLVWSVGGWD